ncbi:MAG TPA: hypothetical protein VGG41_19525 [Solirubrobacteraceae bacterium]|jgi:hypothetical protein
MAVPFRQILQAALAGDNRCAVCRGPVPVSAKSVEDARRLHRDGHLERMDPEGVRMLLVLGSLDAGCGVAAEDAAGRLRVTCPACASADERASALEMIA